MWTAVLDTSGADFEFIGVILGLRSELKRVLQGLPEKRIHMRDFSRRRRSRVARAFLRSASYYRSVSLVSVRTRMREVLAELRLKMRFVPSTKLRNMCYKALAQILISIINQYVGHLNVEVVADAEFKPLQSVFKGIKLLRAEIEPLISLADVLAWLDNNVAKGAWTLSKKYKHLVTRLDVKDRLRMLVGLG